MFLRARTGESLQALMSTALDLEADLKRSKGGNKNHNTTANSGVAERKQDPNREPCKKCKRWKFVWDNCPCGQPAHKKRPGWASQKKVQQVTVNEATLQEDDICASDVEAEHCEEMSIEEQDF